MTVLVVGATGSVGRYVVEEALGRGHHTRALVRGASRSSAVPEGADIVVGDLTDARTLIEAVRGVDAVVLTHGSHGGAAGAEMVDYGAVRAVLTAVGTEPVRIALMTAIGVTRRTPAHDWKRRGERLIRASGHPYTVVRPGWFDYNNPDEVHLRMLQGDRRQAGDPSDGVISRRQIAQVLVASLTSQAADHKTLELVAVSGPAQHDLEPLFADLRPDTPAAPWDGVYDIAGLDAAEEPASVQAHLDTVSVAR